MPPLETLVPFLAQGGVFGLIVWWIRNTHRDAIRAHEKRADDAWAAYEAAMKRSDVRDAQLAHILAAVSKTASVSPPAREGM